MAVITLVGPAITSTLLHEIAVRLTAVRHDVEVLESETARSIRSDRLEQTEILVVARAVCDRSVFRRTPRLRGIVSPLLGIEGIDIAAAAEHGVIVANGPMPSTSDSMAEATFMLILATLYDLVGSIELMRKPAAAGNGRAKHMLFGKTVGILGHGSIAQALLQRLGPWGTRNLVHNRTVPDDVLADREFVEFEKILESSDILVVLLALNRETRHLLDAAALNRMKPTAILINTSRGGIIQEDALPAWLAAHPDRRAALDVYEVEPLPGTSPLRSSGQATLTPHCVGHTSESAAAMPIAALKNIELILAGRAPESTVSGSLVSA